MLNNDSIAAPSNAQPIRADDPPITYAVVWRIRPDKLEVFHSIFEKMIETAASYPGHQGVHAVTPVPQGDPIYRAIIRFDCQSNFLAWHNSVECQRWVKQALELASEPPNLQVRTGLEAWFSDPLHKQLTPALYKTAVLMWLVLFPLTLLFRWIFAFIGLGGLPPIVQTGLMMAIEIALVSYCIMPRLARLFRPWLYPTPHQVSSS
jgi:antibiotic biosynthesis monooxygenase (ABM) superfamily enzyme